MRPLLVFVGPSGVGKSTLVRQLVANGHIKLLPTWTTRPQRPDEIGRETEHKFVSDEELDQAVASGAIIDTMPLFNLPYRYGLPRLETTCSGPIETLMCRAHLLERLSLHSQCFIVYQVEADPEVARQRLEARELEGAELGSRWELFDHELKLGRVAAQRCFVNDGSPEVLYRQVQQALMQDYTL